MRSASPQQTDSTYDTRAEALERSVQFYSALCASPLPGNKPPSAQTVLYTAEAFEAFLISAKVVDTRRGGEAR